MNETPASATQPRPVTTAAQDPVWADWITIWQSELAALAADREVQEASQRGIDLWAEAARAAPSRGPAIA